MADPQELNRDLQVLESDLRKLEAEYNMYFAGRLPRPPFETRSRVAALVKKLDRRHIQNYGDRFRFTTLQARFSSFIDLWDRGLRAREEGRAGPFASRRHEKPAEPAAGAGDEGILFVASFRDPMKEIDKLHELYASVREARERVGEEALPFHKFTEVVKEQVAKLKESGAPEVAFRVAVKDGKLRFTARGLKGAK